MATLMLVGIFIVKAIAFVFGEAFLAMFCLWPINDKPVSRTQFTFFGVISVVFFAWMFNFLPF